MHARFRNADRKDRKSVFKTANKPLAAASLLLILSAMPAVPQLRQGNHSNELLFIAQRFLPADPIAPRRSGQTSQ
jgi:hypothetical protein